MKKEQSQKQEKTGRPWVIGFLLLLAMLPIWPVEGLWFGLPAWAVIAVLASFATSVFIAWWIKYHWPDDEPLSPNPTSSPESE